MGDNFAVKPLTADAQSKIRYGSVSRYWEKFVEEKKDEPDPVKKFLEKRNERIK